MRQSFFIFFNFMHWQREINRDFIVSKIFLIFFPKGLAGNVTYSNWPYYFNMTPSITLSLMRSKHSSFRAMNSSSIAMAGPKCPPVPPQTMEYLLILPKDNTGWSISLGATPMQRTEAYPVAAVGSTQTLP
jgi:hypothetical protein